MTGVYAIAEVVDDSNKRPAKTLLCVLASDGDKTFSTAQVKSLDAVAQMVRRNGGFATDSLDSVAEYINRHFITKTSQ